MRYSENKGYKLGIVSETIELTTAIIILRIKWKWAKIMEGCCAVCTIVWNNNYLQ